VPVLFVRLRGSSKRASTQIILDFFEFYGIPAGDCKIVIPKWRDGEHAGYPRSFCFVEFCDVDRATAALALHGKVLDGVNFEVRVARQGPPPAAKPRAPEHFKPFSENDFR
jgi:RNA recognition motif. (a.k.a. RRM, RBD, or RNP domain)